MEHEGRRALVVGLGIAGISAAIGLRKAGWEPVIIERAPERRRGGYFVGIFPDGKKAAQDLGMATHLHIRNPVEGKDWSVRRSSELRAGAGFLDRRGGPYAVVRGDIEDALWRTLEDVGGAEVRFSTRPVGIEHTAGSARVRMQHRDTGTECVEDFALVVGADGVRSGVRELVFGPHEQFLDEWGAIICAFELDEQVPGLGAQDGLIDARSRRAAWVFGFADRTPTVLLTYRTKNVAAQFERPAIETLREVYAGMDHAGISHVLSELERKDEFLFDSVNQVKMPAWRAGRVVLLGDSAWCMNLYSGMGSSMAMQGGVELGRALQEHPADVPAALEHFENALRPVVTRGQRNARITQQLFVPSGPVAERARSGALGAVGMMGRMKSCGGRAPQSAAAPVSAGR